MQPDDVNFEISESPINDERQSNLVTSRSRMGRRRAQNIAFLASLFILLFSQRNQIASAIIPTRQSPTPIPSLPTPIKLRNLDERLPGYFDRQWESSAILTE